MVSGLLTILRSRHSNDTTTHQNPDHSGSDLRSMVLPLRLISQNYKLRNSTLPYSATNPKSRRRWRQRVAPGANPGVCCFCLIPSCSTPKCLQLIHTFASVESRAAALSLRLFRSEAARMTPRLYSCTFFENFFLTVDTCSFPI